MRLEVTVTVSSACTKPGAFAVISTVPAPTPRTANTAAELPDGIFTTAGATVAMPVLLLAIVMFTPPGGAGCARDTVPLILRLMPIKGLSRTRLIARVLTTTLDVSLEKPVALAVTMAVPPVVPAVTWKVACVALSATVTFAGTVAIAVLLLARSTSCPPVPAGAVRVTVN